MPWPCYLVEQHPDEPSLFYLPPAGGQPSELVHWTTLPPGAIYRDPDFGLIVKLPTGEDWHVEIGGKHRTWKWSGTLPQITVTPSINAVGRYHGWLRKGELTDDIEGRQFPDAAPYTGPTAWPTA